MQIVNGYFIHNDEPFMPVGFNYWPSRTGVHCWRHFNLAEWKEDFTAIKNAGFNTVRMFLLWQDFQPTEDAVDQAMINRLVQVVDAADETGLWLMPTLFQGWMSGTNFDPPWRNDRNHIGDPTLRKAMIRLAKSVAAAVREKKNIIAIDLANEIDVICGDVTSQAVSAWTSELAGVIREERPGTIVTNGSAASPMFAENPWTYADQKVDFVCMHGYPQFRTPLPVRRAGDARSSIVFGGMTAYAGAFGPVMRQEFGTAMGGDSERFGDLIRAGTVASFLAGANGFLYWCWRDVAVRELPYGKHPFESSLGYADVEGNPKTWAKGYDDACRFGLEHTGFAPERSDVAIHLPNLGKGGGHRVDAALATCYENLVACQLNPRFAPDFPADAALVVLPLGDLSIPQIDQLKMYVEGGGRVIVFGVGSQTASRYWEEATGVRQVDFLRIIQPYDWQWGDACFKLAPTADWPMPLMETADDRAEVVAALDDDPILFASHVGQGCIVQTPLPLANAETVDLDAGIVSAWRHLLEAVGYERPIKAESYQLQAAVVKNAAGERRLVVINHSGNSVEDVIQTDGRHIRVSLSAKGIMSVQL